jgi:4-hydroxyphenylpyruvate dioxygenase
VNVILNMEQEGFTHSHYLTHGPALGLWVSDASAQTARAEALLAQVRRQPVGAGPARDPLDPGRGRIAALFPGPWRHAELLQFWEVIWTLGRFDNLVG